MRADLPAARLAESWTVLDSVYLQRSPWRSLRLDRVRLHTGQEISYSYAETPEAVFVVPLTTDGQIVLLRQYRYPLRSWVWEVPAGAVGDETPDASARRELAEEIGGHCGELVPLGPFYSSPAHLTSKNYAFLALDVEPGVQSLEATELLEIFLLDPADAFARARTGDITDGQSALALLKAEPLVRDWLDGRSTP